MRKLCHEVISAYLCTADGLYTFVGILLSESVSQPEAKSQIGPQLTQEVGAFAFLSSYHPHFSGDVKVKILWSSEGGSAKGRMRKCKAIFFFFFYDKTEDMTFVGTTTFRRGSTSPGFTSKFFRMLPVEESCQGWSYFFNYELFSHWLLPN